MGGREGGREGRKEGGREGRRRNEERPHAHTIYLKVKNCEFFEITHLVRESSELPEISRQKQLLQGSECAQGRRNLFQKVM